MTAPELRLAAAALLLAASSAGAQHLLTPEFSFQPGVRTIDTFTDIDGLGPATGFDIRFLTTIPSTWRHVALLIGGSFAPFGLNHGARTANDPVIFFGASFPLLRERRTDGWLTLSLPVLDMYQFDETGTGTDRLYEHDLVVELAANAHIGRKLLSDLGPFWQRVDAYLAIDQTLTPNKDLTTHRRDRFNPVFTYGLSFPLGGGEKH